MSENEIKILEKGLDFPLIQRKINEPELCKDIEEFCKRMRTKWNFRNEPSQNFGVVPAFTCKSSWKPPLRIPNLEVFFSQVAVSHRRISTKEVEKQLGDSMVYETINYDKKIPS